MENFFFVPASKLDKIENILLQGVDNIIIDLEDAVKASDVDRYVEEIIGLDNRVHHIRVPLHDVKDNLNLDILNRLISEGFRKFVFPKLQNEQEVAQVFEVTSQQSIQSILLVEHPLLLINLQRVLEKYGSIFYGIALGSHDIMSHIGGEHTLNNLVYYRNMVLLHARAYNKLAVDIASMELKSEEALKIEILNGFNMGFDAKFLIHPKQFKILRSIQFYTKNDLDWANQIKDRLDTLQDKDDFDPIVINGQIIEKPHIEKAMKILKFYKYES